MKKIVILLALALVMVAPLAYADQTSGATYTSPNGCIPDPFIAAINDQNLIDHSHQYDVDKEHPAGVGVDVIVWNNKDAESKVKGVEIQTKHDFANSETSIFAVLQLDLSALFKKKDVE